LAISVTEELPQLIDKGRARVNGQLAMAKMVGSFAVAQGQREAERVVRQATGRVSEGGPFGAPAAREADPWAQPAREADPTGGDGDGTGVSSTDGTAGSDGAPPATPSTGSTSGEGASAPLPAPGTPSGDASALAIPGYDALSASHVVQRLAGLAADELEAVRTYEAATRGRRTILNRIAQLQAPGRS
jgi:hypothetical protein